MRNRPGWLAALVATVAILVGATGAVLPAAASRAATLRAPAAGHT